MRRILEEHFGYVADTTRLSLYRRALTASITPGNVVVDLGAGTGILGLLACAAGAGRVYAIEESGLIETARALAYENGWGNHLRHLRGHSTSVQVPELADVVICDQLGPAGFEAGIIGVLADAQARWLKPGGQLIPSEVTTWLAPASLADPTPTSRWDQHRMGFSLNAMRLKAAHTPTLVYAKSVDLLGPGVPALRFPLGSTREDQIFHSRSLSWSMAVTGRLNGILVWFAADLAPDVQMTNGPFDTAIDRQALVLPVEPGMDFRAGDEISVQVDVRPPWRVVVWSVALIRDGRPWKAVTRSTLQGRLLSTEDLRSSQQ